ncbi:MAG: hypothetical protein JNK58_00215 [Phycisphaerae bacterium]|nr:hypothetical protein [Phycisphaerae bacterium]
MIPSAFRQFLFLSLLIPAAFIAPWPARADEPTPAVPTTLAQEPYTIPNLGLSFLPPEGSIIDLSRIEGGRTTVVIAPQDKQHSFVFQVMQSISADRSLELSEAVKNIVDQRRTFHTGKNQRGRSVSTVRVFDTDDNLLIGQHPAQRVYLDVPLDTTVPVTGYTVFHTGPGQFVIFQMDCPVSLFPKVRSLYELMIASAEFKDPEALGTERATALLAGRALLERFNSSDFEAALDKEPVYYRLYRPNPTGSDEFDEEVGYQRVQIVAGVAGDLDPAKPEQRRTTADRQPGYLTRVEARALASGAVVDSVSLYFLSADRTTELWSITMAVRKGNKTEQWVETGIRRDDRLTVKTTHSGEEPTNADWSPIPESYLSRVESYLLPRLVARAGMSGVFGFYTYDSTLAKMTLRRETFAASDKSAYIMTSLASENSRPTTTELDAQGRIIRRVNADGQIMEPIDQPRLKKLWTNKKLPLE